MTQKAPNSPQGGRAAFFQNKERWQVLAALAVFVLLLVPMLVLCGLAGPSADDFNHMLEPMAQINQGSTVLQAALQATVERFFHWQGTYFSMFINALAPFHYLGFGAMPVVFALMLLAFCGALFALVRTMLACVLGCRQWSVSCWCFLAVFFLCTQFTHPSELFYWYSGLTSYTLPFTCLLLGGVLVCRAVCARGMGARPMVLLAGGMLCLFCACGGTLIVGTFACYFFCLAAAVMLWQKRPGAGMVLACALLCVACTGANVLAPGNYVRQTALQGQNKVSLLRAMVFTLHNAIDAYTQHYPLVMAAGVLLLLAVPVARAVAGSGFSFRFPGLAALAGAGGLYLCLFPYVYASGDPYAYSYRVEGLLQWCATLVWVAVWFYLLGWWMTRDGRAAGAEGASGPPQPQAVRRAAAPLALAAALLLVVGFAATPAHQLVSLAAVDEYAQGVAQAHQQYTNMVLAALQAPGNGPVQVPAQQQPSRLLMPLSLQPDAGHWINDGMAIYFGKESLALA